MSKHTERVMELRNKEGVLCNCAETIMMTYAEELGLKEEMAKNLATNFGGGMKCGKTCGAITSSLMVLGAMGVNDPVVTGGFVRAIRDNHDGLTDCSELLKRNVEMGGQKKPHCDKMIVEAIELMDNTIAAQQKN